MTNTMPEAEAETVVERFGRTVRDRAEPGTPWRAACERTMEIADGPIGAGGCGWEGPLLLDGLAALALGLHLVAASRPCAVDEVVRADLDELAAVRSPARVAVWEPLLRAAGHDPADPADPVAAVWRHLAADTGPAEIHPDLLTTTRSGPGLRDGLDAVLAPMWGLRW